MLRRIILAELLLEWFSKAKLFQVDTDNQLTKVKCLVSVFNGCAISMRWRAGFKMTDLVINRKIEVT